MLQSLMLHNDHFSRLTEFIFKGEFIMKVLCAAEWRRILIL